MNYVWKGKGGGGGRDEGEGWGLRESRCGERRALAFDEDSVDVFEIDDVWKVKGRGGTVDETTKQNITLIDNFENVLDRDVKFYLQISSSEGEGAWGGGG